MKKVRRRQEATSDALSFARTSCMRWSSPKMPQCYVTDCTNYYGKTRGNSNVSYHMIPSAPSLAARWAKACTGTSQAPPRYMRVCSDHFSERCYQRDLQHELMGLPLRRRLKPDAVPDLQLRKRPSNYAPPSPPRTFVGKPNGAEASRTSPATFKIPMRSSIRIAKRESLGSAADLQSPKVKKKAKVNVKRLERERFVRKIKYMRQLRLNFQKNEVAGKVVSPKNVKPGNSLNKMHVMEDVREGCDTQPSSPGHAEQRSEITESQPASDEEAPSKTPDDEIKLEDEDTSAEYTQMDDSKDDSKKSGDDSRAESSPKRKTQSDELPVKKAKGELQQEFFLRNKILSDYTDSLDMGNFDQIQNQTEQLLVEIQSLAELAKEKEREWNQIVHEKKMKEELLMRIQRQKQVCLLSNGLEISETEPAEERAPSNGEHARQKYAAQRRRQEIGRQKLLSSLDINGHDPKANRQRPVRDVQSIIADYRQKHPETVPRRGRRIRASVNGQSGDGKANCGVLNFSNMALGSGSQVRQNSNSSSFDNSTELGLLLSAMESVNQEMSAPSSTEPHDTTSFKDILVRFAKLSQSERQELLHNKPPPPYPEVTVHAVSTTTPATNATNSLLHGILTKTQNKTTENKSAFSPTLARLLTAPERSVASQQNQIPFANHSTTKSAANVSISDILSSNKARNEITITPVGAEYEDSPKRKTNQGDEDEAEDSVDRLVIDESGEIIDTRTDNNSDTGDEVPQCQGCNIKAAQFVCAGCANQWYCSRECQVTAWDEHSEVCSG